MTKHAPSFKFITIGESGAGKTSLVTRLVRDKFKNNTAQTIGADFFEYDTSVGNSPVQIVIWDTAGQERFHTIVRSYYRLSLGIIVVFDITSRASFDNVPRWLRDARQDADPQCQVLLVGNKRDLFENRQVSEDEAMKFAEENQIKYIETSAKNDENVKEAFLMLAEDIYKKMVTGQLQENAYSKKSIIDDEPVKKVYINCCS